MADLSITAANVVAGAYSRSEAGVLGEAGTAGQVVYKKASDGKFWLADADSTTAEIRQPDGILLNGGAAGQPCKVLTQGDITIGGTLVAGSVYYLSPTPGGIGLIAEVLTGDYICMIGIAHSTSVLNVAINYTGVAVPP